MRMIAFVCQQFTIMPNAFILIYTSASTVMLLLEIKPISFTHYGLHMEYTGFLTVHLEFRQIVYSALFL